MIFCIILDLFKTVSSNSLFRNDLLISILCDNIIYTIILNTYSFLIVLYEIYKDFNIERCCFKQSEYLIRDNE